MHLSTLSEVVDPLRYEQLALQRSRKNQGNGMDLSYPNERRSALKLPVPPNRHASKSSHASKARHLPSSERKTPGNHLCGNGKKQSPEKIQWNVLDLKAENYFSCAVGRTRTSARYLLGSSDDVVSFLKELSHAAALSDS